MAGGGVLFQRPLDRSLNEGRERSNVDFCGRSFLGRRRTKVLRQGCPYCVQRIARRPLRLEQRDKGRGCRKWGSRGSQALEFILSMCEAPGYLRPGEKQNLTSVLILKVSPWLLYGEQIMLPWWWAWGQKLSKNKVVKVCYGSERDESGMNDLQRWWKVVGLWL